MYITTKLHILLLAIVGAFFIIMLRLVHLQIYEQHYFTAKSHKNFLRLEATDSTRGDIVDRNGILLATNQPLYDIYWQGMGNTTVSQAQEELLIFLQTLLVNETVHIKKSDINRIERLRHKVLLYKNISYDHLCKITEIMANNPNIVIHTRFQRSYPYKNVASHLIGYLGNAAYQAHGKMGLEKLFEDNLRGKKGTLLNAINSCGTRLLTTQINEPTTGSTIQTTLDIRLQMIAEEVFPVESSGALIVMDPETGDILSAVSRPAFDPTLFLKPIPTLVWNHMQHESTFINRIFALYPPGSIFKLITTSAALEHGIIHQSNTLFCKGYYRFAGRNYLCASHRKIGAEKLSLKQAVAKSCNSLFFDIATKLDINTIAQYAYKFGLGKKTGIIFNEPAGLVPHRTWKLAAKKERWFTGETLSVAIGQGALEVSPLQVARMIGGIGTGYLVRPRILTDELIDTEPLDIQPETRDFLLRSMKAVIRYGTGKRLAVKDLTIYAKTSTAQVSSLEKTKADKKYLENGWFAAFWTYKQEKPLVLIIVVERAGTSQVPLAIAKNFLLAYKKLVDTKIT